MPKKTIILIACATMVLCYFLPIPINCVTASFLHGNIFHLAINVYTLWIMLRFPIIIRHFKTNLIASYLISVLSFALSPSLAIGASGIIYALAGIVLIENLCKRNIVIIGIMIGFSFLPNIATAVHLYSLLFGCTFSLCRKFLIPNS